MRLVARLSVPARAGIMSFLLPGLGQVYLRRLGRAAIWFFGLIALSSATGAEGTARWVPLALGGVLGIFSAVDAVVIARSGPPRS